MRDWKINYKIELFRSIVNKMADLYALKNENYGDSFGKLYNELGPIAGLVPLFNKIHRAESMVKDPKTNHFESLEDTFIDLACYAVMNAIEARTRAEEAVCCQEDLFDDEQEV